MEGEGADSVSQLVKSKLGEEGWRGGVLFAELNAVNSIRAKLNENQCNYPISMGLNSPWLLLFTIYIILPHVM